MSDFYAPYKKVLRAWTLPQSEEWIAKLRDYLLYMPYPGVEQTDDNDNPRVRLTKYLYYDGANPLSQPMPTTAQKLSIVFNPQKQDAPPTEKGYRFFTQGFTSQAQLEGQTILRVLVGRVIPTSVFAVQTAVIFEILTNVAYESNTDSTALSRVYAMETAIIDALNGVNMQGVGSWYFDRRQHTDCGSYQINDETHNVGRRLTLGFTSMSDE